MRKMLIAGGLAALAVAGTVKLSGILDADKVEGSYQPSQTTIERKLELPDLPKATCHMLDTLNNHPDAFSAEEDSAERFNHSLALVLAIAINEGALTGKYNEERVELDIKHPSRAVGLNGITPIVLKSLQEEKAMQEAWLDAYPTHKSVPPFAIEDMLSYRENAAVAGCYLRMLENRFENMLRTNYAGCYKSDILLENDATVLALISYNLGPTKVAGMLDDFSCRRINRLSPAQYVLDQMRTWIVQGHYEYIQPWSYPGRVIALTQIIQGALDQMPGLSYRHCNLLDDKRYKAFSAKEARKMLMTDPDMTEKRAKKLIPDFIPWYYVSDFENRAAEHITTATFYAMAAERQ